MSTFEKYERKMKNYENKKVNSFEARINEQFHSMSST